MYGSRKACLKDIDAIVELWKEFMEDQNRFILPEGNERFNLEFKEDSHLIFREFCRRSIHSNQGLIIVTEFKGEVVGYLLGFIQKFVPVFKLERIAYISDVYVKEDHRSCGVATMMKDMFEEWSKSKGISHVSIQVIHSNSRAHDLYHRWGYQDIYHSMRKKI